MSNLTYVGEVAGNPIFKEQTSSEFYIDKDGTVSTNSSDGVKFVWDTKDEPITDLETGQSTTFGGFLNSLGTTANTLLDLINKTANTYEQTTGSKLITTSSDEIKSTGKLNDTDMNTLTMIINSAINKLKTYGIYVGIGVAGIILASMIIKNKKAKAK